MSIHMYMYIPHAIQVHVFSIYIYNYKCVIMMMQTTSATNQIKHGGV